MHRVVKPRRCGSAFLLAVAVAGGGAGAVAASAANFIAGASAIAGAGAANALPPPLLPQKVVAALANELSGEAAKRNLEGLARFHRQRGSQGFHSAAELIAQQARAYGLEEVQILRFPADGKIFYGTQRSRMGWDAEEGELSEVRETGESRIGTYSAEPVVLAEDSESADVTAELIDVGEGAGEGDYAGGDVAGKLVLVSSSPGEAQDLAVGRFHAAGIVSYAQNQKTAWSGENDNLIRWGHLQSFSRNPTFAFMVSLRTARALQARLKAGEKIRLHAHVKAGQHPADYEVVTARITGADPQLRESEIAFSCHLDHQRPGANDNASGCVTILEASRTLQRLVSSGALRRPARSLRFIWPPEVEGTITLLNAQPEFAHRIKAVIHMDMVGGGPETKAVFHVTRGPMSLPSFVHDVAWAFADWANEQTYRFAATGESEYPLTAPEGGREPLRAEYSAYTMGSDHDVYQDASFAIPSIYLNDWPDRYIHTNFDTAANIDPTKLKRAAFIGAASGYFLADFSQADTGATERVVERGKLLRMAALIRTPAEARTHVAETGEYERGVLESVHDFASGRGVLPSSSQALHESPVSAKASRSPGGASLATVFHRRSQPKGPLMVFGYDYFEDHASAAGIATPKLLAFKGASGSGEEYAYEALNFADGKRSVRQIAAALSAEYGAVPPELVLEYLQALQRIGVVE